MFFLHQCLNFVIEIFVSLITFAFQSLNSSLILEKIYHIELYEPGDGGEFGLIRLSLQIDFKGKQLVSKAWL
jgi:hypothetical protein